MVPAIMPNSATHSGPIFKSSSMAMAIGNTKTADISHNGVVTCGVPKRLAIKKGTTRMPTKPIKPATITKPAHKPLRKPTSLPLAR